MSSMLFTDRAHVLRMTEPLMRDERVWDRRRSALRKWIAWCWLATTPMSLLIGFFGYLTPLESSGPAMSGLVALLWFAGASVF